VNLSRLAETGPLLSVAHGVYQVIGAVCPPHLDMKVAWCRPRDRVDAGHLGGVLADADRMGLIDMRRLEPTTPASRRNFPSTTSSRTFANIRDAERPRGHARRSPAQDLRADGDIRIGEIWYRLPVAALSGGTMARTVIDLDDEKLALAAEIFGTTTKVATVNAALEDVVKRRKRESFADWLKEGGLPDLTGPVDNQATPDQVA
jgi:Arc/MetJ family transcription regulator